MQWTLCLALACVAGRQLCNTLPNSGSCGRLCAQMRAHCPGQCRRRQRCACDSQGVVPFCSVAEGMQHALSCEYAASYFTRPHWNRSIPKALESWSNTVPTEFLPCFKCVIPCCFWLLKVLKSHLDAVILGGKAVRQQLLRAMHIDQSKAMLAL